MSSVIIMFTLMLISFTGYGIYLKSKFNLVPAAIPIVLFSSIVVVLFISGLVQLILPAVYLIFAVGLLLFVYGLFLMARDKRLFINLLTPSTVFFIAGTAFFAFLLRDAIFIQYDIFSHWGLIVKEMVEENSLPDRSTVITFRNYPPGTAIFVYYVVTLVGYSESAALIGQGVLIAGLLSTFFIFSSWKKPFAVIASFFVALFLLLVDGDNVYSLLVDLILGYIPAAALLVAYYYRDRFEKMTVLLMPILSFVILTKDSGKIFYAFCLIWLIGLMINYVKNHRLKGRAKGKAFLCGFVNLLAIPIAMNFLFMAYTLFAYDASYGSNRHAVTAGRFSLDRFTSDFGRTMVSKLGHAIADSTLVHLMVISSVIAVAAIFIIRALDKRWPKTLSWSVIFVNLFQALYGALLYLLYLFLMPENEAINLAGFTRYEASAAIFCMGTLLVFIIREITRLERYWLLKVVMAASIGLLLLPIKGEADALLHQKMSKGSLRLEALDMYHKLEKAENISGQDEVTLIQDLGHRDSFYLDHVMTYERLNFNTYTFTYCDSEKLKQRLNKDLKKSDYLVVTRNIGKDMKQCIGSQMEVKKGAYKVEDGKITERVNLPQGDETEQ
ncbi:hypothetical protein MUN89_05075 [Halobacillus salinarum]|uniref:Glycosyltransferase RgtA/B/C/D-like domain-containing protein n=1 Tax=Halobacillus salinarum TaxID=2932257 RepID=A0ABY4ELJ0_9BACI|nr:hypothetical protein [Halobacillus salinarum]UOQ45323.1 hypothetical protein MUN89_05075 [Halobacillus salinarum]